jgi:2-methylisocitrate lyase-like PEP mutase family enzyme
VAFTEAGADCLYTPGVQKKEDIAAMVRAVAPQPVNVLVMNPAMTVAELAGLGVRRVSVGGSLALVAWGATLAAAEKFGRIRLSRTFFMRDFLYSEIASAVSDGITAAR